MTKVSDEQKKLAVEKVGKEPIAEIGTCFDSTAKTVIASMSENLHHSFRVCHGIGISNFPGQEGSKMGHSWIESEGLAYDTTWGVSAPADFYRCNLTLSYVVEYTLDQFLDKAYKTDTSGPWDKKILKITERKK